MRELKWLGKFTPFGRRKEDDDAPVAARLRSRDKEVEPSQTHQRNNGVTCSNNQTDNKQSQHFKHNISSVFPHDMHSSRQSNETKSSPSENYYEHREKQITASKRFAQPKISEANNDAPSSSSSHQVRREKMKDVGLSEESSKYRPLLKHPDDLPVLEPHTCYIRSEESQRRLVGWTCEFCEKDAGVSPFEEEEDSYMYPEVSVFSCGHVYHSSCLQRFQFGDRDLSDGPCIFCLSLLP